MTITEYEKEASRKQSTAGKLNYANGIVALLIAENEKLKEQVKHLDEENTKADAIIADRDAYIKQADATIASLRAEVENKERQCKVYEEAIDNYRSDGRKMLARIKSLEITVLEKENQIRMLTNDLNDTKLNASAPQPKTYGTPIPNLPEGVSGVCYQLGKDSDGRAALEGSKATSTISCSSVPLSEIIQRLKEPEQTSSQKILSILKRLDPERMVFEFSLVSKEVSRIISDNKSKSASASDLLNKLS